MGARAGGNSREIFLNGFTVKKKRLISKDETVNYILVEAKAR